MNSLETRKQLLISESEVNRVMLVRECEVLRDGFRGLAHKAKRWGVIASSLLLLARGLSGASRQREPGEKRTATQTLFAGLRGAASLLFTLWTKPR